ncbi:hypothetical protein CRG98_000690 [Punica granatum]|uniref:Reverse transcriptase domain-containing protein n=1 Tax=Punica granatum TaxID=22663 RepID=A0A2I0LE16_PUNGR|nr:hypothetical protein CRG98_000690 [Punica granatum]
MASGDSFSRPSVARPQESRDSQAALHLSARMRTSTRLKFGCVQALQEPVSPNSGLPNYFSREAGYDFQVLVRPVSSEEVRFALFAMGPYKAPGPDGFPAIFFQAYRAVVEPSLVEFVRSVIDRGMSVSNVNDTLLVLISKVELPESIHQFRLISLCNVSYKLITKVIANRLQGYMAELVSPNQVSFVPRQHIQDNIVIAQVLVHSMHRMRRRKKFMAIKVDLEKAYDRLNWNFVVNTLVAARVPEKLQLIIKDCISSVGMNVLWNGSLTEEFNSGRGIRQGCPLSPYLFVLCVEHLSHLIREAVEAKVWQPMHVGRDGPWISHLMFTDDILLFAKALENQITTVCTMTSFAQCRRRSSFKMSSTLGHYLGVPIVHGRLCRKHFEQIVSRVQDRINGWTARTLSMVGRVTLAKSVIQVVPSLTMQVMRLPANVCEQLHRHCHDCSRSSLEVRNGQRVMFWEDRWVAGCRPLLQHIRRAPDEAILNRKVAEFAHLSGSWNWELI